MNVPATTPLDGVDRPPSPSGPPGASPTLKGFELLGGLGVIVVLLVGVALRFVARSDLWLDEALSVNIARLALGDIPEALRHDGHPPLYYVLLHGWMSIFGTGDLAVRALSGLFSVGAIAAAWRAGRRLAGTDAATAAVVLVASSPFAIRYAVETRMYSLLVLLTLLGYLAVSNAIGRPSAWHLTAVGLVTGALVLTHYWALYLLAACLAVVGVDVMRGHRRSAGLRVLGALAVGSLALVPWLPSLFYQLVHTGTPWSVGTRPLHDAIETLTDFGGGPGWYAHLLTLVLGGLCLFGLFGGAITGARTQHDRGGRPGWAEGGVAVLTMVLGLFVGELSGAAYDGRYASVAFPLVILVAALGVRRIPRRGPQLLLLTGAAALGLAGGLGHVQRTRTQAGEVAAAIASGGAPGDVVAYCPDQLGPSVDRLLPEGFVQVTFPAGAGPERVDWADYRRRNEAGDPDAFARQVLALAGDDDVWLVWAPEYRTLGRSCEGLERALSSTGRRAVEVVQFDGPIFESHWLVRYPGG